MRLGRRSTCAAAALFLSLVAAAGAHVSESSGPYRLTLGWGNEPAISGSENHVSVAVADRSGAPVAVPAGALDVDVSFGGEATTLPLLPSERRGELRAVIVPTRPGTYGFHVSGRLGGKAIEARATCGGG